MKNEFKPNSDYKVEIMENFYKAAMARAEKAEAKVATLTNALEIAEEALKGDIFGRSPRHYILEQFPATVGHLPLAKWFDRLEEALEAVAKAKGEV